MATIHPFRGVRYNTDLVGDLSKVVTQPYDRIGLQEMQEYLTRSPYNVVRITGGKRPPAEDADYKRRAELFRSWLDQGVLQRDPTPGLYAYHQVFEHEGQTWTRRGVVCLLDLREGGGAKAHERTLKGPKEDRLKLLRATRANFGHIFMLYSDPQRRASGPLEAQISGRPPIARAQDDFGNDHLLWQVTDKATVEEVRAALADVVPYIADGHHRFETARAYMEECLRRGLVPSGPESFASRMVTLVNVAEPGCVVRPTPRVVHSLPSFSLEMFLSQADRDFDVSPVPSLEAAKVHLQEGGAAGRPVFVAYAQGRFFGLELRDPAAVDRLVPGPHAPEWKRLDVAILHGAILERMFGITEEKLASQSHVDYAHDADEAVRTVDTGKGQVAFLLNPTRAEQVMAVADRGERMPQKSTDFYPKLLTGMVAMRMD